MSAPAHRLPGRWITFVHRYGWRAYALPILTVITLAAIVRGTPSDASTAPAASRPQHAAAAASARGQHIEGVTGGAADFEPASTPKPVTIHLADESTSCAGNQNDQLVIVSLSKQRLWACDGQKQVNAAPITSGKHVDNDQTPVGTWRVQAKERDRYLVGPGYRDYVKYWVPFNGDFGFHDASWQTIPFGSQKYLRQGSHGCVHLPTPVMAWLYHWTSVNDTVVDVEA